jgi:hypothetical protein
MILAVMLLALTACEDFLTRRPKDELSPDTYFKTETECQLYTNNFYTILPAATDFYQEDDDYIIPNSLSTKVIGNRVVPTTSGTWNWNMLRQINFFLSRSHQCEDNDVRERYEALARFFRAYFYFEKVKRYGDVAWVDEPIDANDKTLYRGRDPRAMVMEHVLEDIDFAIENLPSGRDVYRVTKWTALALKSRIFLFEGTFRKYHGLQGWEDCLKESAAASLKFINESGYGIYKSGTTPYQSLFTLADSDRSEVILTRAYKQSISLVHDANGAFTSTTSSRNGLAKDVVDMYLMSDGSRFTDKPRYNAMDFYAETQDRDPRLAQTIRTPGYTRMGDTELLAPNMAAVTTGYQPIKYVCEKKYDSYQTSENDMPVFRTAEVYLNYAEAKAELNEQLTQGDLDISVNKIRARVSMPPINMAQANADPDPYLLDKTTGYPNVSKCANTGVILEIRRERTVELILEGFRYWDLMRWKEGKRFERPFYGMRLDGVGEYDLDRNGTVDLVVYEGDAPATAQGVVYKSLSELNLSSETEGNIVLHEDIIRTFDESKDYLYPIPTEDIVLTQGVVKQNPGWDDMDGLDF